MIERSRFEPWPGHCVVFLGKTLYSHSASLHPKRVPANYQGNLAKCCEVSCDGLASHPGGVTLSRFTFLFFFKNMKFYF